MSEEEKMGDSLCGDCATVNENGTPCGTMFSGDQVEACNTHVSDPKKHEKLAEKYGPKLESPKDVSKGVK